MTEPTSALDAIDASLSKVREKQGLSLGSFTASLLAGAATLIVDICLLVVLKHRLPHLNDAHPPVQGRPPSFYSQLMSLLRSALGPPNSHLTDHHGVDAYFFLRYAILNLRIFAPLAVLTNAVLLPLHTVHGRNGSGGIEGLDRLSWANIRPTHTHRYWAHAILLVVLAAYVCTVVWVEMGQFARFRQQQLTSRGHGKLAYSRTVLLASISPADLAPAHLERAFGWLPGGVQNVWVNRDCRRLAGKIQEHARAAKRLEAAETELIRRACRAAASDRLMREGGSEASRVDAVRWLLQSQRRSIRRPLRAWAPSLPLVGDIVEEVEFYRSVYVRSAEQVEQERRNIDDAPRSNSAFLQFAQQRTAHVVAQVLNHHSPAKMVPTCLGAPPEDILWENISIEWWQGVVRSVLTKLAISVLVVLFAVPVACTSLISQISYLTSAIPGLGWLNGLPDWSLSIIQGVVPPVMLSCLIWCLSAVLRVCVLAQGLPTRSAVDLAVQKYYFGFLFIQIFLIVLMAAGFVSVKRLAHDGLLSILDALVRSVPRAGNYFLGYMLLQAFSHSGSTLTQVLRIDRLVAGPLLDRTPTQMIARDRRTLRINWSISFPICTTLACIGFIYSVVSPLILLFEVVAFVTILTTYYYNISRAPSYPRDSSGFFYTAALEQLLVGVYVMEGSVFILMLLITDADGEPACAGQAILVFIAGICTTIFHYLLRRTFGSLFLYLPTTLQEQRGEEHGSGKADEAGVSSGTGVWNLIEEDSEARFTPPIVTSSHTLVRIPRDTFGFSKEEISQARSYSELINITDEQANVDSRGRISLEKKVSL